MITKLIYNWHQVGDSQSGLGEDYLLAELGKEHSNEKKIVSQINEHIDLHEKASYDIVFEDKSSITVFNPNTVFRN
tara:strand:- start:8083 stop:8310 length:228 start_codon:yes stop_codon:yes gene_type:complete